MADNGTPLYPSIIVSDAGAPEGFCNVHDQATGTTVMAAATQDGISAAVRDLNNRDN